MIGMNRHTGKPLAVADHLKQSIIDILTTHKGTRRMRLDYGSDLPNLVDMPTNVGLISAFQSEAAIAIARWEPRLKLSTVRVLSIINGKIQLQINGDFLGDNTIISVTI